MKPIAIAFIWALFLSFLVGLCLAGIFYWWSWPWWVYPLGTASYTLWFGWRDAHDLLAKRLGRREGQYGVSRSTRTIPVSLDAGVVFESVMPSWISGKAKKGVRVDNSYTLFSPRAVVREGVANEFIRYCQIRKERGKAAFSRRYWTKTRRPPLTREEYDCLMSNLVDFGFIEGRRQGSSGRLNAHSEKIIGKLRRHLN